MHAKFFSALGEVMHNTLAIALLVVILSLVCVFRTLGQHGVDKTSQFVGGNCPGSIKASDKPSEVGPKRRLAFVKCGGR